MKLKPDIEADITMLPAESSPRKGPIHDDIIGYYGCPMVLPSGNWDCRMVFPDAHGKIDFGQTTRALIQFLSPQDALKGVREGDCFELWEMGIIATGIVKKIMESPALATSENKMEYIKVKWIHSFSDEPVLLYSEIDEERWEQRKVEVFADGRIGYAGGEISTENTGLGEVPILQLKEIAADPQFQPEVISKDEFEVVWARALAGHKKN